MFHFLRMRIFGLILFSGLLVACGGGTQEVQADLKDVSSSGPEASEAGEPQTAANGGTSTGPSQEPKPGQEPTSASDSGRIWIDELAGDALVPADRVNHDAFWAVGSPASIGTPNPAIRQNLLIRDEVSWQAFRSDTAVNLAFLGEGPSPVIDFNTQQVVVLGLGNHGLSVVTKTLRSGGVLQVLVGDRYIDSLGTTIIDELSLSANLRVLVLPQSEEVRVTRHRFPAGLIPLAVQTDIPLLSPAEELTPVRFGGGGFGHSHSGLAPSAAYLIPDMATWLTYQQLAPDHVNLGDGELPTIDFNTHQILAIHVANPGGCVSSGHTVLRSGNLVQVSLWERAGPPDRSCAAVMSFYDLFLVIPRTDTVQVIQLPIQPWS